MKEWVVAREKGGTWYGMSVMDIIQGPTTSNRYLIYIKPWQCSVSLSYCFLQNFGKQKPTWLHYMPREIKPPSHSIILCYKTTGNSTFIDVQLAKTDKSKKAQKVLVIISVNTFISQLIRWKILKAKEWREYRWGLRSHFRIRHNLIEDPI